MDEALDPDIEARALALDAAMWFYEKSGEPVESVEDVTNVAEIFAHYLTNGQANEFNCKDASRKFVRGGN